MEKIQEILNKGWKQYKETHKVVGYKKKAGISIGMLSGDNGISNARIFLAFFLFLV